MSKQLLTHRILEESAGEWRFTYTVPLEGASSYTYRSKVFNTRLEALTGMMDVADRSNRRSRPAGVLPRASRPVAGLGAD